MKRNYLLAILVSLATLTGCITWSTEQNPPPSGSPGLRGAQDRSGGTGN